MIKDDFVMAGIMLGMFALCVALVGYALWHEQRYPCKRYASYTCTQQACADIGDPPILICTEYQTTRTGCADQLVEKP